MAALALMLLTLRLGFWQLDRAAQKQALHDAIMQSAALPPLDASQLALAAPGAETQHYRRIVVSGHWLERFTVFLDNRQMGGRPGFFVMTPLALAAGDAVLVQRGWVARDPQDRTRVPALPEETGPVRLLARVAPPPSRLLDFSTGEAGRIRQNLDIDAYAREIGVPLRPLSLQQLESQQPSASTDRLLREWPMPAADIHKHHGYAFQWFAFSALTAGLYVWFQLLRPRLARRTH